MKNGKKVLIGFDNMKRVVISEDFREFELHPPDTFDKYLRIIKDELHLLIKKWDLFDINCPACNSNEKELAFSKFGMKYVECKNCKTLYVTPRPSENDISTFYRTSKAMKYWNEHFYKETIISRKRVILKPRALWVVNVTENYFKKPKHFIDVKSKYFDFLKEIEKHNLFEKISMVDPLIDVNSSGRPQHMQTVMKPLTKISSEECRCHAISALEVVDRISNPRGFLSKARSLLLDKGLLFLTTSTISGFDLQILWNHSKSIYPLDHINLFSIEGIIKLLSSCGFDIIELSTTGQLDLEIVKHAKKNKPDLEIPRFISYLIDYRNDNAHRAFQEFLQRFNLSSHLRIAAQKS